MEGRHVISQIPAWSCLLLTKSDCFAAAVCLGLCGTKEAPKEKEKSHNALFKPSSPDFL